MPAAPPRSSERAVPLAAYAASIRAVFGAEETPRERRCAICGDPLPETEDAAVIGGTNGGERLFACEDCFGTPVEDDDGDE